MFSNLNLKFKKNQKSLIMHVCNLYWRWLCLWWKNPRVYRIPNLSPRKGRYQFCPIIINSGYVINKQLQRWLNDQRISIPYYTDIDINQCILHCHRVTKYVHTLSILKFWRLFIERYVRNSIINILCLILSRIHVQNCRVGIENIPMHEYLHITT